MNQSSKILVIQCSARLRFLNRLNDNNIIHLDDARNVENKYESHEFDKSIFVYIMETPAE